MKTNLKLSLLSVILVVFSVMTASAKTTSVGQQDAHKNSNPKQIRNTASMTKKTTKKSVVKEVILGNATLKKSLMSMRYCNTIADGEPTAKLTFYMDNSVIQIELSANSGGGAYGDAYSGAYAGATTAGADGPYGSQANNEVKGTWSISKSHVIIDLGNGKQTLYFGKKSFTQHRCFLSVKDIQ